jgi:hypothetical protein
MLPPAGAPLLPPPPLPPPPAPRAPRFIFR